MVYVIPSTITGGIKMSKKIKDEYDYLENNISVGEFMEYCKDNGLECAYKQNLYDSIVDGLLEMSIDTITWDRDDV